MGLPEHLPRHHGVTTLMALQTIEYAAWCRHWLRAIQEG